MLKKGDFIVEKIYKLPGCLVVTVRGNRSAFFAVSSDVFKKENFIVENIYWGHFR